MRNVAIGNYVAT